ncbi:MAG: Crp/Fnr family transcriptional regulator [Flavobacteriales bacterium]
MKKNYDQDSYANVVKNRYVIECKKSQSFIIEGAPVQGIFFVYSGKAKVTRTGANGKEQVIRLASNGDIIGHRGYNRGTVYPIAATALEDTTLCYFHQKYFTHEMQTHNALTYDLMLFYADELDKSEARAKKYAQMNVKEKVIDTLLAIHDRFGQDTKGLRFVLSRTELANVAGTKSEQLIRSLTALKNEGFIECEGKHIRIKDAETLRKEIERYNF